MRWALWVSAGLLLLAPPRSVAGQSPAAVGPSWKYPPEMPEARVEVFKRTEQGELRAWIFSPPAGPATERSTERGRPAIVFFFGGGWRGGTPGQFYPQCRYLASRGMVAITVDYRVRGRHQVLAPTCLADARSAIRWVRAESARLGIDPQRVVAAGGSAGGHLAACLGVVPGFDDPADDRSVSAVPNAMALYNPAVLLSEIDGPQQLEADKLADLQERTGNQARELSPLLQVREGLPPSIIFHGTQDEAVPFWTVERFAKQMRAAGNRCELKAFTDAPHGFFNTGRGGNPERLDLEAQRYATTTWQLDRFLSSLGYLQGPPTLAASESRNVQLRGTCANSLRRFGQDGQGHVAFLGGSITEMEGYRPRVTQWLEKRFPEAKFQWTNAGIASTCSNTGAFRLATDVLDQGPVDLLLVEFAVNDDQDAGHDAEGCVRGMEGIVRHLRHRHPRADIVMVHFVNPGMLQLLQEGRTPVSIASHEAVARHYGVSSVYLARELADRVQAGSMTWQQYGGTHPGPAGNQLAADLVAQLLDAAWSVPGPVADHPLPEPLNPASYAGGRFLDLSQLPAAEGWAYAEPNWKSIRGSLRARFANRSLLSCEQPGQPLVVEFEGQALGAYLLAGPDAGILEVQIDDQPLRRIDLYHRFSKGLHYPRTVVFAYDLPPGKHRATLSLARDKNPQSQGTAARILQLVTNHNP